MYIRVIRRERVLKRSIAKQPLRDEVTLRSRER
jgi:hypothetical protein